MEAGRGRACLAGFHVQDADGTPRTRGSVLEFRQMRRSGDCKTGFLQSRLPQPGAGGEERRAPAGLRSCALVEECASGRTQREAAVVQEADGFSQPGRRARICHPHSPKPGKEAPSWSRRAGPVQEPALQPPSLPRGACSSFACWIFCLLGISIVSDTSWMI